MSCSPKIHLRIQLRLSAFLHQSCIKGSVMADLLISTNFQPWRDHTLFWMVPSNSCSSNAAITLQLRYIPFDNKVVVKSLYLCVLNHFALLNFINRPYLKE